MQQRPGERQHERHRRDGHPQHRGLRLAGAADQRDVEQHQPGPRDPEQPQPVRPARDIVLAVPGDEPDTAVAVRLLDRGVRVQPLSLHRMLPGPPGLVVGYAAHSPDRLRAAAARLVDGLR